MQGKAWPLRLQRFIGIHLVGEVSTGLGGGEGFTMIVTLGRRNLPLTDDIVKSIPLLFRTIDSEVGDHDC